MSPIAVGVVALFLVAVTFAGCGGSGGTESNTSDETETTTLSEATVTSFDVGELRCGGAVTAPVDVTWATEGATVVAIAVDNITPVRLGASGTTVMLVPCDDDPHGISITALDAAGDPGEKETEELSD
jgi:hypothetical protein